jgi:hypothetical protein
MGDRQGVGNGTDGLLFAGHYGPEEDSEAPASTRLLRVSRPAGLLRFARYSCATEVIGYDADDDVAQPGMRRLVVKRSQPDPAILNLA